MIRLPELSDIEADALHQNYVSLTDIFLQGVILYLFGEREDGFHKAFSVLRRTYEGYEVDDQLLEEKLSKFLGRLAKSNVSAWTNLVRITTRDKSMQRLVTRICPLRGK